MTIAGRLKTETAAAHDRFWGFYAGAEPQLDRWHERARLGAAGPTEAQCDALVAACRDPEALDDATVLVLRRA